MRAATLQYIEQHVFCRCGQAVSRLAEEGIVDRTAFPSSETEVNEWWLVSTELAERLKAARLPVVQFGELSMWGRTGCSRTLSDDVELIGAIAARH